MDYVQYMEMRKMREDVLATLFGALSSLEENNRRHLMEQLAQDVEHVQQLSEEEMGNEYYFDYTVACAAKAGPKRPA